jgi:hypothetical protein
MLIPSVKSKPNIIEELGVTTFITRNPVKIGS